MCSLLVQLRWDTVECNQYRTLKWGDACLILLIKRKAFLWKEPSIVICRSRMCLPNLYGKCKQLLFDFILGGWQIVGFLDSSDSFENISLTVLIGSYQFFELFQNNPNKGHKTEFSKFSWFLTLIFRLSLTLDIGMPCKWWVKFLRSLLR